MRFTTRYLLTGIALLASWPTLASADTSSPVVPFVLDPASVQHLGPAYRYPQAGWIVLHVEGEPYERGYQHGYLLASEIVDYVNALAKLRSPTAPVDAWRSQRLLCNALFLRRYEREYLEEMKGIADGAAAAGAKYDGRPIDLEDVVAINSGIEMDFLDSAVDATPTGLEGLRFKEPLYAKPKKMPPSHCSAFAATGPATADGKIVFGHITMFSLYTVRHFNVWLDLKPAKGHRVLMQTFPGGIMSGMDYYQNDAGLLVSETTIAQTGFDVNGASLVSRIRKAVQYADNIDDAVKILGAENNGLYANEWLLADVKTNEIAMYELGTKQSRLWRSSKGEWLGGTDGFYWGCNNTKDLQVRMETFPSVLGRPRNVAFRPSDRDVKWQELYRQNKGKITADFGFKAFTTAPLAAFSSCDAKFTTTDLAKKLQSYALFGPPLGKTWDVTSDELRRLPDIKALVSNDWTLLAPLNVQQKPSGPVARDLTPAWQRTEEQAIALAGEPKPAWHGTILPATDADTWLATAFADYERIAALENALRSQSQNGKLSAVDQRRLDVALFAQRSKFRMARQRLGKEFSPDHTKADWTNNDWYDLVAGKGVLLLHALRQRMGAEKFDRVMDEFGLANAGKPVTTAAFRDHCEKHGATIRDLLVLYFHGTEQQNENAAAGERSSHRQQDDVRAHFARGIWSIDGFGKDLERTLIVYGTLADVSAQQEAASILQRRIARRWGNHHPPIRADKDVTEEEARTHHLLLIGRPASNALTARVASALPVTFGPASFTLQDRSFANAQSAVIAVGTNPSSTRYSVVVFAGLSAGGTWHCVNDGPLSRGDDLATEVIVMPASGVVERWAPNFRDPWSGNTAEVGTRNVPASPKDTRP